MSDVAAAFTRAFGAPQPRVKPLSFPDRPAIHVWNHYAPIVGSGWFRDRFLCLFGDMLQPLNACLDAWPFLVPKRDERLIIGRNAHGAIAFVDDFATAAPRLYVVDPLNVDLLSDNDLNLFTFIDLPENRIPVFTDDTLYRRSRDKGVALDEDEILAIDVPLALGGKAELDNFHVEDILEHYQATGPIYAKGFKKKKK
jgi:hypothetical protein